MTFGGGGGGHRVEEMTIEKRLAVDGRNGFRRFAR
jgi:hypothetical protein